MKNLHLAIAVITAFISGAANAQVFAGFDSFCGLPIVVENDPQVASARKDQFGNRFIHVDPGAMANWTMSRMFTLAHECAHHLLGHTTPIGELQRFSGGTARQELEADCWAAQALKNTGYDSDITRTILEQANQGHFASPGYPTGRQRAENILQCAGSGTSCRDVVEQETYMDIEIQMQPVQVLCQHCGCNNWGQCGCAHQFDVVPQQVQVPVQKTRPVTRRVCN